MGQWLFRKPEPSDVRGVCVCCGKNPQKTNGNGKYKAICSQCDRWKYKHKIDDHLSAQSDTCQICGVLAKDAHSGKLYIDHCHETKKVRGMLCHHCNTLIGMAKDDTSILNKAIEYLSSR